MESIPNERNTVFHHFGVSLSKNMDSKSDKPFKMESKNSKKRIKYKKCDPIGAAFQIFPSSKFRFRTRHSILF